MFQCLGSKDCGEMIIFSIEIKSKNTPWKKRLQTAPKRFGPTLMWPVCLKSFLVLGFDCSARTTVFVVIWTLIRLVTTNMVCPQQQLFSTTQPKFRYVHICYAVRSYLYPALLKAFAFSRGYSAQKTCTRVGISNIRDNALGCHTKQRNGTKLGTGLICTIKKKKVRLVTKRKPRPQAWIRAKH